MLIKTKGSLGAFGSWTRMKAALIQLEAVPEMDWSPRARELWGKGSAMSASDVSALSELIASEWSASPKRAMYEERLSRLFTLGAPKDGEGYHLHYPLWRVSLSMGKGDEPKIHERINGEPVRLGSDGEISIDRWPSEKRSRFPASMALHQSFQNEPFEKILQQCKANEIVLESSQKTWGSSTANLMVKAMAALKADVDLKPSKGALIGSQNEFLKGIEAMASMANERGRWVADLRDALSSSSAKGLFKKLRDDPQAKLDEKSCVAFAKAAEEAMVELLSGQRMDAQDQVIAVAMCALLPWADRSWAEGGKGEKLKQAIHAGRAGRSAMDDKGLKNLRDISTNMLDRIGQVFQSRLGGRDQYERDADWGQRRMIEHLSPVFGSPSEAMRKLGQMAGRHLDESSMNSERGKWDGEWGFWQEVASYGGKPELNWMDLSFAPGEARVENGQTPATTSDWGKLGLAYEKAMRQSWQGAMAIATGREAAWARAHGLEQLAMKIEEGWGHEVGQGDFEAEMARVKIEREKSPSARLWAVLDAAHRQGPGERVVGSARSILAAMGIDAGRMDAFAATERGEAFVGLCKRALSSEFETIRKKDAFGSNRRDANVWNGLLSLMLAFERDGANPDPRGGWTAAMDQERQDGLIKAAFSHKSTHLESLFNWVEAAGAAGRSSGSAVWAQWVEGEMGGGDGFEWAARRLEEQGKQAGIFARHHWDQCMGREPVDPKPNLSRASESLKRSWGSVSEWVRPKGLPYDWAQEASLGPKMFPNSDALAKAPLDDVEVEKILKQEGFAGRMGVLACLAGRDAGIKPDASPRSRANAWLAAGKQAAKDWFGFSESGWRLARESGLAHSEMTRTGARKAFKELSSLGIGESGARGKLKDRSEEERLAHCFSLAGARGLDARAAMAVAAGLKAWQSGLLTPRDNLCASTAYLERVLAPLSEGVSLVRIFDGASKELRSQAGARDRFESAVMDRAAELRDAELKRGGEKAKTSSAAAKVLEAEMSEMADWANDRVGRFWSQMGKKIVYAELARGSREWHDEQQTRKVNDLGTWDGIGLNWSDPERGLSCVELLSAHALSAEGKAMRHCVGSYSSNCRSGSSRIISIRKDGARLATLELAPPQAARSPEGYLEPAEGAWKINQLKGACNSEPGALTKQAAGMIKAQAEELWTSKAKAATEANAQAIEVEKPMELEFPGFDAAAARDKILEKRKQSLEKKEMEKLELEKKSGRSNQR